MGLNLHTEYLHIVGLAMYNVHKFFVYQSKKTEIYMYTRMEITHRINGVNFTILLNHILIVLIFYWKLDFFC